MLSELSSITIFFKEVQPEKASSPIRPTLCGTNISVKDLQSPKAPARIVSILEGIIICFRFSQP